MSCDVGLRGGSNPALLWCRLAALAPIRPLAWEPPNAAGAALKGKINLKKERKKERKESDYRGTGCCRGVGLLPGTVG